MTKPGSAIALTSALLLLAAACGSGQPAKTGAGTGAAGSPPQLRSVHQLQTVFNSASKEPTLVVLLSPT